MGKYLKQLIKIGSAALASNSTVLNPKVIGFDSSLFEELSIFLNMKNGFYAFESALHVFPITTTPDEIGLIDWNVQNLWVGEYKNLIHNCFFFAEDIFGGQFCIRGDSVFSFDPETGDFEFMASNLDGWAKIVLDDYNLVTGYPIAHSWQESNGILHQGLRLIPKVPFVLGGEFQIENLIALESVKAMHLRADLATQIHTLPDGAAINWKINFD